MDHKDESAFTVLNALVTAHPGVDHAELASRSALFIEKGP